MTAEVPLDEEEFRRWRREAQRTFESARHQADGGFYNWACFAAEQAAQLAVKGFLHGLGRGPWGHDLVGLVRSLADAGADVPDDVGAAALRLSRHYIPARYPDTHASGAAADRYGAADADQALGDAELVLELIDSRWAALGD
jgi:HEPN domain-containing protein